MDNNNTCDNCFGVGHFCDHEPARGHGCTRCLHLGLPCRQNNGVPVLPRPSNEVKVCWHCLINGNPSCDIDTVNNWGCTTCAYEGRPCMVNVRPLNARPVPQLQICDPCETDHMASCSWLSHGDQVDQEACNNCMARNILCTRHGVAPARTMALSNAANQAEDMPSDDNVAVPDQSMAAPAPVAAPPPVVAPGNQAAGGPGQAMRQCTREHHRLRPISDFSYNSRGVLHKTCDPCHNDPILPQHDASQSPDLPAANPAFSFASGDVGLSAQNDARMLIDPALAALDDQPAHIDTDYGDFGGAQQPQIDWGLNLDHLNGVFPILFASDIPETRPDEGYDDYQTGNRPVAVPHAPGNGPFGNMVATTAPQPPFGDAYRPIAVPHGPGNGPFGNMVATPAPQRQVGNAYRPIAPRAVDDELFDNMFAASAHQPDANHGYCSDLPPLPDNGLYGNGVSTSANQAAPTNPVPPPHQAARGLSSEVVAIPTDDGRFRCPHPNCAESRKTFKTAGGVKAHHTTVHARPLQSPPVPLPAFANSVPDSNAANDSQPEAPEYDCPYCDRTNFKAHGLKIHIRRIHPGQEVPVFEDVPDKQLCVYCGLYFLARGLGPHKSSHGVTDEPRGMLKPRWQ